jgi:hypothetical protein
MDIHSLDSNTSGGAHPEFPANREKNQGIFHLTFLLCLEQSLNTIKFGSVRIATRFSFCPLNRVARRLSCTLSSLFSDSDRLFYRSATIVALYRAPRSPGSPGQSETAAYAADQVPSSPDSAHHGLADENCRPPEGGWIVALTLQRQPASSAMLIAAAAQFHPPRRARSTQ